MTLPIEDYGLIGDLHTAALVGRNGSIDWLCLPRFDSASCFARILGEPDHGFWQLAPTARKYTTRRQYRKDTLVLETEFETGTGAVRLIDCMPIREDAPQVVRVVEGVRGHVDMAMRLQIRFGYGAVVPWVRSSGSLISAVAGPEALALWTPVETHGRDLTTAADFTVRQGEQVPFVLSWFPSHLDAPRPVDPRFAIEDTQLWWEDWSSHCTFVGPWRDAVMRSLITLKALTYQPTGGIVAAPTTSLPETLGGGRNWDYRYCWLRDATLTLESLMRGGYFDEAMAWRNWLLRAVAGDPADLQIMYGPGGERRLDEWEVPWLRGYENSAPVRIGNAAAGQFQLDVYGEVMSALYVASKVGGVLSETVWDLQRILIKFVEEKWSEPDDGIWEVRGPRRHFTHSKVMAWVAVDRAIKMVDDCGESGPAAEWRKLADTIHEQVCAEGFNEKVGAFTQYYGSDALDASLLMIPLVDFLPATDPRVRSTIEAIESDLTEDGFVLRYRATEAHSVDGLEGHEGAFLACSFWLADCLRLIGRQDDANALLSRLVGLSNDLGLLSEEYDAVTKRQVGNFPQAFSHVSLVNSAYNLTGHPEVEEAEPQPSTAALAPSRMRQWRRAGRHSSGVAPSRSLRRTPK
ncbi:MAG: glycoside hydrolase family 15 protein [Acidimicrobiales bacterium]